MPLVLTLYMLICCCFLYIGCGCGTDAAREFPARRVTGFLRCLPAVANMNLLFQVGCLCLRYSKWSELVLSNTEPLVEHRGGRTSMPLMRAAGEAVIVCPLLSSNLLSRCCCWTFAVCLPLCAFSFWTSVDNESSSQPSRAHRGRRAAYLWCHFERTWGWFWTCRRRYASPSSLGMARCRRIGC